MKHIFIKGGLFSRRNKNEVNGNELSLTSWLKKILTSFGVTFNDPCCDVNSDFRPVRYNSDEGYTEYYSYDEDANEWMWQRLSPAFQWVIVNNTEDTINVTYVNPDGESDNADVGGDGGTLYLTGLSVDYNPDLSYTFLGYN